MIYALQDATQRSLAPLEALAAMGTWLTNPLMSASAQRWNQAWFSLLTRLSKVYDKPRFNIERVATLGGDMEVDEAVVMVKPFCDLLHFAKRRADRGPPLLILAPLSGHHSTLLRGTVEAMLEEHDVFITDWRNARSVPVETGKFDLSDYVRYVQEFVRFVGHDVHVLAVCQPCVAALAAVSLMEQNKEHLVPRSLTLIAGPVDTRLSPTAVNRFATERDLAFFQEKIISKVPMGYAGTGRRVYPGFMQLAGFVLMNRDKHRQAYSDYFHAVAAGDANGAAKHEEFYDDYNAVLDMPAEYYLETLAKIFLKSQLADGTLEVCGQVVDPAAMRRTALLTIEGDKDDVTGAGQTHVSHQLCKAIPKEMRGKLDMKGVGHYGVFAGSQFKAQAVPVISQFIRKHA